MSGSNTKANGRIGVLVADAFAFILIWWHKLMPHLSKKDPKVKQVPIV